jgi:hypothetical protein
MTRPVFLVGSVPYEAEETFERCSSSLGRLVKRLPDGEKRGWLPAEGFTRTEGLEPGRGESISGPPFWATVRIKTGVKPEDIRFEHLFYHAHARSSYDIFKRLRAQGKIAAGVRFQVSIPTPFTSLITFDWDQLRAIWPVYERALFREIEQILAAIPHEDLAISWDVCEFVMALVHKQAPEKYTLEELGSAVARCIDQVPTGVETGCHFCYGGYNSNGLPDDPRQRRLEDTGLFVKFGNYVFDQVHRRVNWLHLPVPQSHDDDAFFAPLTDLNLKQTELYLGLVYLDDGIEASKRKIAAASRYVASFGVATACGMGNPANRVSIERMPELIHYHRSVAELA